MNKIIDVIESFDGEYKQLLMTILMNIPEEKIIDFYELIIKAESEGMKIYIDETGIEDVLWDSLDFNRIKIK